MCGPIPSPMAPRPTTGCLIFGGSAWQWDTRRCQYYLHHFLISQPDLNFHNPQVQQALLGTVRFWLDLGVDGYRLDAVNFFFHDVQLRDNPGRAHRIQTTPTPRSTRSIPTGGSATSTTKADPRTCLFCSACGLYPTGTRIPPWLGKSATTTDWRGWPSTPPGATNCTWRIASTCWALRTMPPFCTASWRVSTGSSVTAGPAGPCPTTMWCAWRRGGAEPIPTHVCCGLAAAFQVSLRGTACLYQGEELGLPEAQRLRFEDLQDPYGITMWPQFQGRDGCRTPMPWQANALHAGFTAGDKPWLPVATIHRALAVDQQAGKPNSMLSFFTQLLRWRRAQVALREGALTLLPVEPQVLAFTREHPAQTLLRALQLQRPARVHWRCQRRGVAPACSRVAACKARAATRVTAILGAACFCRRPPSRRPAKPGAAEVRCASQQLRQVPAR